MTDVTLAEVLATAEQDGTAPRYQVPENWAQGRTAFGGFTGALLVNAARRDRPDLPATAKGGETIRISFKLSAAELARLAAWYDPLGLGLATKSVAPLLAQALRDEVTQICAAAR